MARSSPGENRMKKECEKAVGVGFLVHFRFFLYFGLLRQWP